MENDNEDFEENEEQIDPINKIINEQDKNNYKLSIEELSRKSIINGKKINSFFKFSNNSIFYSITEKELYEEFKSSFNIKNEKYNFKIENLFASDLFELFPLTTMTIIFGNSTIVFISCIFFFSEHIEQNSNIISFVINLFISSSKLISLLYLSIFKSKVLW